jgi:hypothetical protein
LGLYRLVEIFADKVNATPEERLAYHLAADGDDQSHMIWSHATEQAIQSWGGPENYHEQIWPAVAELGGTVAALDKYNITVDKDIQIPGIEIPAWINDEHPNLNLDRFQYAVTELLLWFDHEEASPEIRELIRQICSPENLTITDKGQLAFNNPDIARIFAKGYLLLATEHWNDPINRVQLHLLIHATQRAIVKRRIEGMGEIDKGETRKPESYFLGIDQDIVDAMDTGPGRADDFVYAIKNALYPIAMQERQRYLDYKMNEYATFLLDAKARDYPSEFLSPRRVEFGPPSSQVEVQIAKGKEGPARQAAKIPTLDMGAEGIRYHLGPLKNRYIDPLVLTDGVAVKLSDLDPNYNRLLKQQQTIQKMSIVVNLAFAGGFEKAFKDGVKLNDKEFSRVKRRSPMTDDQQRRVIEMAAQRAKQMNITAGSVVLKQAIKSS